MLILLIYESQPRLSMNDFYRKYHFIVAGLFSLALKSCHKMKYVNKQV